MAEGVPERPTAVGVMPLLPSLSVTLLPPSSALPMFSERTMTAEKAQTIIRNPINTGNSCNVGKLNEIN